ncbi:MAG: AAA family ATPase [Candidatus Marinimicrobia bacterium]|nr:AAA family ATPase [Candidatus Neomarinimicrobiota bacterium]MCF7830183.1 AAA family ATPase [Candidatus Neomarinimicrobiota bacterium]MCF7882083.1 AAA family ATPase [Candidatus Neomarinimicrobiota bacterium]
MEYFNLLGLEREPFSTTPDPEFFYRSQEHKECLYRLEITLRLQRGLSVIIGNVGTGKTTLCRTFLRTLEDTDNNKFIYRMIQDPSFNSEYQFLQSLIDLFEIPESPRSTLESKNVIQNFLFEKGVVEKKSPVLIIDEGQNLTPTYIEALRVLLNYETNKEKLLQLVIFAQNEFLERLKKQQNFYDRIAMGYFINALNEEDTKALIRFRLKKAGLDDDKRLFDDNALHRIYLYTRGYPRRIISICHEALITMIREEKEICDSELIEDIILEKEKWSP